MTRAYLGLGSNLGDRRGHLQRAVDLLGAAAAVKVIAASPVYETDPVGGPEQGDYLNAVIGVETDLSPRGLLDLARRLEDDAERVRDERWGPRTLDVDVLLVGDHEVREPDLTVPHPRLHERAFVLVPLGDLDPDLAARVAPEQRGETGVRATGVRLVVPESP